MSDSSVTRQALDSLANGLDNAVSNAAAELPHPANWWHKEKNRVVCDLCPRHCALKEEQHGFCFVRKNVGDQLVLLTYGRSTGFCIDPVEKKPLNHFYPGTSVLSYGTAGCNLGCKFCQAWEITKSHEVLHLLSQRATPQVIARAAQELAFHVPVDCKAPGG